MLREGTNDLKAIWGNAPSPTVPLSSIYPIAIQRNHFRLIYRNLHEIDGSRASVAAAPAQSQLKPEAEPSLAEAQPELPSDGSHISANSGSG